MSDDIVSLRMMLIGAAAADRELWRQAAALSSVMLEFDAHDASAAAGALGKNGTDICVLDAALSDAEKTAAIEAARAAKPVPLIFACAGKNNIRHQGVDGQFTKPAGIEDARKLVEICVRAKFPIRVLIVDDSRTVRSIVRKILSASRFTLDVHEAAEEQAALEQLRGGNFGMVFLDDSMPGRDAFETLPEIKRASPNAAVVMMTKTLKNGFAERTRAAGALACLKKPFYPADIDAMLERYFGLNVPVK